MPIHSGCTDINCTHSRLGASQVKNTLRECGLSCINVCKNAEVTQQLSFHHSVAFEGVLDAVMPPGDSGGTGDAGGTATPGEPGGSGTSGGSGGLENTPLPGAPTPTVQQGGVIDLQASKTGYRIDTKRINNQDNCSLIYIAGKVTDQEGKALAGVTVEVVSGASKLDAITNADGTYWMLIDVPGGDGKCVISEANFTLQLDGDLSINRIEVFQAVSGADLISGKSVAVLVFPQLTSQANASLGTQVSLYVNGQLFKTLPFQVSVNYTQDKHKKVQDALKFVVPPSFLRTGPFEVRAVIDPANTFVESDEANNEKTHTQMVVSTRGLSVVMVALDPSIQAGAAQTWATEARRFMANTYPVPVVRIVPHPVYANGWLSMATGSRRTASLSAWVVSLQEHAEDLSGGCQKQKIFLFMCLLTEILTDLDQSTGH
jgi:hypothetical protein